MPPRSPGTTRGGSGPPLVAVLPRCPRAAGRRDRPSRTGRTVGRDELVAAQDDRVVAPPGAAAGTPTAPAHAAGRGWRGHGRPRPAAATQVDDRSKNRGPLRRSR